MGTEVWLDPTGEESRLSNGTLVLSCMPALTTVTSVRQTGRIAPSQLLSVRIISLSMSQWTHQFCSVWKLARVDVMIFIRLLLKHYLIALRVLSRSFVSLRRIASNLCCLLSPCKHNNP